MASGYVSALPDSPQFIYSLEAEAGAETGFDEDSSTSIKTKRHQMDQSGILKKLAYILLSFVCSIGINLYNTYLFSKQRYNLGLPMFAAAWYELTQLVLASIFIMIIEWRTGPGVVGSFKLLPRRYFMRFILPCGFAAGLNIALSNCSLKYISLSFYTMVKSCAPIFVLIFAFMMGLEKPNFTLFGIIAFIGVGIVFTVWGAFNFNMFGFALVFGATIVSGLRWTLTQFIIESKAQPEDLEEEEEMNSSGPLKTLLFLAPVIAASLLILSFVFEGPAVIWSSAFFSSFSSSATSFGVCLFGGLQTFTLMLLEYKVVQETSVLTFSVSGIIKELVIIGLSTLIFGDRIHLINMVGVAITIVGLCFYNLYKIKILMASTGHDDDEPRRKRLAGTTIKNVFASLPTSEPPGWMIGEIDTAAKAGDFNEPSWFYAPHPSPKALRLRSDRHSVFESPFKDSRNVFLGRPGGSLKSNCDSSPASIRKSALAHGSLESPIELNKV